MNGLSNVLMIPGMGDEFSSLRSLLFGNDEQGAWPLPDKFGQPLTLYQEHTGQNIVTAVGQPVGLAIDWRLGRTLGPELVTNGTFDSNTTGWTANAGAIVTWADQRLRLERVSAATDQARTTITTVIGRWYQINIGYTNTISGSGIGTVRVGSAAGLSDNVTTTSFSESVSAIFFATETTTHISLGRSASGVSDFDNISVRELPGNHAYQATASKRPLLACVPARGRVNELLNTENVENAVWTKVGGATGTNGIVGNDGSLTACRISGMTVDVERVTQTIRSGASIDGLTFTGSIWLKGEGANIGTSTRVVFKRQTGGSFAGVNIDHTLTADWVKVSGTFTGVVSNTGVRISFERLSGGADSVLFWQPQLELGATATNYQRVGAGIFDVTEVGQPTLFGWLFDGVDDNLETNAIDPGTDKVTVVAGVRKLSDATTGVILETSASTAVNDGTILLAAPSSSNSYIFRSRGTANRDTAGGAFANAPDSAVITCLGDISAPLASLRRNGVEISSSGLTQGTGNYTSQKGFIGGRAGTSLFFNGYIFALCLRFAATDASLLKRLENFVAQKTIGTNL